MLENKEMTFNSDDVEDLKGRIRKLSNENQDLRMKNSELQKHLDEALKLLFKNTIKVLEKRENIKLKVISSENARTILFTDSFKQLAYLKDDALIYIKESNRRFAYDNASKFKWFIWSKKEAPEKKDDLKTYFEEAETDNKSFKDTFHKVRIQDLPAYLKIFRYEEILKTSDVMVVAQTQWAKYERGEAEPSSGTVKKLEDFCNIEVVYETGMKTIRIHGFGDRLRDELINKRIRQSELAEKIGVKQVNISNYTNQGNYPLANTGVLNKIAKELDESICYLLTGTREWEI